MTKKATLTILLFVFISTSLFSQEKKTYVLYDKEGKETKYEKMLKGLLEAQVVFFGEFHNDAIAHWLQLELANDMRSNHIRGFSIGAEMFESDDQLIIDEYLNGTITEKNFNKEAKLWPNYETDYRPLMELAKTFNFPFIATNIPRRYANLVYREGFEGLDKLDSSAVQYIAPQPMEYDSTVTCYKQMMSMGHGHANPNMPKAQAIKDATMAHFIAENIEPYSLMLHVNGAYHSDNYEGIVWYLKKLIKPEKIKTISVVYQDNLNELEESNYNKADYIFVINQNVTKTH